MREDRVVLEDEANAALAHRRTRHVALAVLSSATIRLVSDLPMMNSKLLSVGCLGHHVRSAPVADHSPTGYLVSRFPGERALGKVALVAGSLSYRGHEEREMGFRHVLAEMSAGLQMLEVREMRDDPERAYLETATFLDRHPDLVAIYNVGAGNTGAAQALKERGRERLVIFVGHEVTDGT